MKIACLCNIHYLKLNKTKDHEGKCCQGISERIKGFFCSYCPVWNNYRSKILLLTKGQGGIYALPSAVEHSLAHSVYDRWMGQFVFAFYRCIYMTKLVSGYYLLYPAMCWLLQSSSLRQFNTLNQNSKGRT